MFDAMQAGTALKWDHVPELRNPVLIAGFHGWSNAGSVSSDTLEYLIETLNPRPFAQLNQEPFINFTLDRPVGQIDEGVISELEPLVTDLYYWRGAEEGRDLILLLAKEPHLGWSTFAATALEVMAKLGAGKLCTVGGVQDTVTHYSEPVLSVVGSSPYIVSATVGLGNGMRPAEYMGPVSIHSYLVNKCTDSGLEAVSVWGHVPAYLQKSPRVVARIVDVLNKALGLKCPTEDLLQRAMEFDHRIREALMKDPNLKQLVDAMEKEAVASRPARQDDKVIRLNDFLRRGSHEDPKR